MDRETLERYLREAHTHVARGQEHVRRQRRIVLEFGLAGHDTTIAKGVLETFETSQAIHEDDFKRMAASLAGMSKCCAVADLALASSRLIRPCRLV
jgi:hypothetical protein